MKKFFIMCLIILLLVSMLALSGCNQEIIDTTFSFDYAIVKMPDGSVQTLKIQSWNDFENSDQLQIRTPDGTVYLIHSVNTILVKKGQK